MKMTYDETIDFLYNQLPVFQRVGASAYKPGLGTSLELSQIFGNPQNYYPTIHVGGTNGKGSTAHTLAAILQSAGYKVGLYTSPHLVDFRERIRVNGEMITRDAVIDFVERFCSVSMVGHPTFFELTMVMAFEYFSKQNVDVAVIEVGLGGRLDSTNIITPSLSIITNISFDHIQFLGNTLTAIATEKAGIIKPGVPIVIGEANSEVRYVFDQFAKAVDAPIRYAEDDKTFLSTERNGDVVLYRGTKFGDLQGELTGECQLKNTATILTAIDILVSIGWDIKSQHVANGLSHVCELTGLMGRWMKLQAQPLVICDTGHNEGGWQYLSHQLRLYGSKAHIVIGFVDDKDIDRIIELLPKDAHYYFTQASVKRALAVADLTDRATKKGLHGEAFESVVEAYLCALTRVGDSEIVFIGGSTYVVADLMCYLQR